MTLISNFFNVIITYPTSNLITCFKRMSMKD